MYYHDTNSFHPDSYTFLETRHPCCGIANLHSFMIFCNTFHGRQIFFGTTSQDLLRPGQSSDMDHWLWNFWKRWTVTSVRLRLESDLGFGAGSVASEVTVAFMEWDRPDATIESSCAFHGVQNMTDLRCTQAVVICICRGSNSPCLKWKHRWLDVRYLLSLRIFDVLKWLERVHGGDYL